MAEYKYRNLPTTKSGWHVSGIDRLSGGSGVLEWCHSEDDANRVMALMYKDPRFANLSVGCSPG